MAAATAAARKGVMAQAAAAAAAAVATRTAAVAARVGVVTGAAAAAVATWTAAAAAAAAAAARVAVATAAAAAAVATWTAVAAARVGEATAAAAVARPRRMALSLLARPPDGRLRRPAERHAAPPPPWPPSRPPWPPLPSSEPPPQWPRATVTEAAKTTRTRTPERTRTELGRRCTEQLLGPQHPYRRPCLLDRWPSRRFGRRCCFAREARPALRSAEPAPPHQPPWPVLVAYQGRALLQRWRPCRHSRCAAARRQRRPPAVRIDSRHSSAAAPVKK